MSLERPIATRFVELRLGDEWLAEQSLIAEIVSRGGNPDELVVDVIDLVVDGNNLTARIRRDRLLDFITKLASALVDSRDGGKAIVPLAVEPWEFALVPADELVVLSLYSIGSAGLIAARNVPVPRTLFEAEVRDAGQGLLADVEEAGLEHPMVERCRQALARLQPIYPGADEIADVASHEPRWVTLEADHLDRYLALRFDGNDPDLHAYDGAHPFDRHALLVPGQLSLSVEGQPPIMLHRGNGVLTALERLTERLRKSLAAAPEQGPRPVNLPGQAMADALDEALERVSVGDLIRLLAHLIRLMTSWLEEHVPNQLENQRWQSLAERAEAVASWAGDLRRGDEFLDDPSRLDGNFHQVEDADNAQQIRFPYPVDLRRLKLLNCDVVWSATGDRLEFGLTHVVDEHLLTVIDAQARVLDLRTGKVCWEAPVTPTPDVHLIRDRDPAVLVLDDDGCGLLDLVSGARRWHCGTFFGSAWLEAPVRLVRGDDGAVVLIATSDHRLLALDAESGEIRWEEVLEHGDWAAVETGGPVACVVTDDGLLQGIHVWTGEELWRVALRGDVVVHARVVGDTIAALLLGESGQHRLMAWSLSSGRPRWDVELGRSEVLWLRALGNSFVVSSVGERGVVWRAFTEEGSQVWRCPLPFQTDSIESAVLSTPTSELVWVIDDRDTLCAVRKSDGKLAWVRTLASPYAGPVVGELQLAGDILVATRGAVYLIDATSGDALCAVGGLEEDPAMVRVTPSFDLVIGEESFDGSRLSLHRAGHFIAVIK